MSLLNRLRKYKEIIVVYDYTFSGGGARPIHTYYRHQVSKGQKGILLLRLVTRWAQIKLLILSLFSQRLIVNGISPFYFWVTPLVCFFHRNVVVYLHEAEPHVAPFREGHPFLHKLFSRILKRQKVAFVSEWQARYFHNHYALGKTAVLYNTMPLPPAVPAGRVNIAMVAYQTQNKNVDFFSEIADRAVALGKAYQFHWIGGEGGDAHNLYHSAQVNWWGDQEQVMDLLNGMDMLLFTSKSDTFGLVLAEALYKGKHVVTYSENGMAAFIAPLPGCRVFTRFNTDEVLAEIEAALAEPVDMEKNRALIRELCSVEKLEHRLNQLFEG